ncbi:MAG: hypothetical protein ACYC1A_02540 [Spirochaetales bacterium]
MTTLPAPRHSFLLSRFSLWFYAAYIIAAGAGIFFIRFETPSVSTLLAVFVYIASSYFGLKIGEWLPDFFGTSGSVKKPSTLVWPGAIFVSAMVLVMWLFMIKRYGSLQYIFANAFTIRLESIGASSSVYPTIVSYGASLGYALFALALFSRKWMAAILLFADIALVDMVTFGRVGTLFAIFLVVAWYLIRRLKILTGRNIILFTFLVAALVMPRLVRGNFDNFEGTVSNYRPYFRNTPPSIFNVFIGNYIYYFSSGYALNSYMNSGWEEEARSGGSRILAPVLNIVSKFTHDPRVEMRDEMSEIPFEFNIYTVIHDWITDFGILGLAIGPLILNAIFSMLSRGTGLVSDAIKSFTAAYIFYSPIYYIFSFGGFLISLLFLIMLRFITLPSLPDETRADASI